VNLAVKVKAITILFNFVSIKILKLITMKKLLLIITVFSAAVSNLSAQTCTPGSNYPNATWADTIYGAYPDTIQNIPPGAVGVPYSTDLTFKVPAEVTPNLDPTGFAVGFPIQDFTVTGVTGLPAGFDYGCNISSCTFAGGTLGCANLFGTPAATGIYPLTINVDAIILISNPQLPFLPPVPVPQSTTFDGYKLVIGNAGIIEAIINPITIHPNPASDKITLDGLNEQMKISSVVITNMEGKVIKNVTVTSATMDVNLNGFDNGVYFVVVNHAGGTETLKFIKE
jgi:hypothetical protein